MQIEWLILSIFVFLFIFLGNLFVSSIDNYVNCELAKGAV